MSRLVFTSACPFAANPLPPARADCPAGLLPRRRRRTVSRNPKNASPSVGNRVARSNFRREVHAVSTWRYPGMLTGPIFPTIDPCRPPRRRRRRDSSRGRTGSTRSIRFTAATTVAAAIDFRAALTCRGSIACRGERRLRPTLVHSSRTVGNAGPPTPKRCTTKGSRGRRREGLRRRRGTERGGLMREATVMETEHSRRASRCLRRHCLFAHTTPARSFPGVTRTPHNPLAETCLLLGIGTSVFGMAAFATESLAVSTAAVTSTVSESRRTRLGGWVGGRRGVLSVEAWRTGRPSPLCTRVRSGRQESVEAPSWSSGETHRRRGVLLGREAVSAVAVAATAVVEAVAAVAAAELAVLAAAAVVS